MDVRDKAPGLTEVLDAVSSTQLKRYNRESIALMQSALKQWTSELSTPDQTVAPYFIKVDFESIADPETRILFDNVATSLALPADEVDNLTETGRRLLRESPEFRDLVAHVQSLGKGDRTDNAASTR
jgi:hypothetical protein